MKKNQERRLHRKNAKIVKEGGTPMQLNRPVKPDTTVRVPSMDRHRQHAHRRSQRRCGHCGQMGHMSGCHFALRFSDRHSTDSEPRPSQKPTANALAGPSSTPGRLRCRRRARAPPLARPRRRLRAAGCCTPRTR